MDLCPRPFKGVVLCATGIQDKVCCVLPSAPAGRADRRCLARQTSLFKQALELGAMPLPDLTDKVTHLLATECGSAKYKVRAHTRCALQARTHVRLMSSVR